MTDEQDPRQSGERAYFRLSSQGWSGVWPTMGQRLHSLRERLEAVLNDQQRETGALSPADLALEFGTTATALFELLAPEERALRDVVTTLRTALALCWDMYSYQEASHVTVQAHMQRLQSEIEGFEAQLEQVQAAQEAPEH